ncbi:hypothetical protein AB0L62_00425 [Nocardia asteroides]|uniref:hypothetical protein n=1 Tax=Nocardia asteroides TaxID=1824 RepID=UPI003432AD21
MMIKQFVAHRTPTKAHIFAIDRRDDFWARADGLELVTTVGRDQLSMVDGLITDLNMYLSDPDRKDPAGVGMHELPETLSRLPSAVAESIDRFIRRRCDESQFGEYGDQGPIHTVDWYPPSLDALPTGWNSLDQLFSVITGHGDVSVRWQVVEGCSGQLEWEPEARTERPHVRYDDPCPAGWVRPHGMAPTLVWTSWVIGELRDEDFVEVPLREGLRLAADAFDAGKMARIYPVWTNVWWDKPRRHGNTGSASVEWIVEVFDAAPPTGDNDRDESSSAAVTDVRSSAMTVAVNPFEDELAARRHQHMVERLSTDRSAGDPMTYARLMDCLQTDMRNSLDPANRGFGGELLLGAELTGKIVDQHGIADLRKAARQAARNLGWMPKTHLANGRFFVYDSREIPEDVRTLMDRRAAEVIQAAITGQPHPGTGGGVIPAAHRLGVSVRAAFSSLPEQD